MAEKNSQKFDQSAMYFRLELIMRNVLKNVL